MSSRVRQLQTPNCSIPSSPSSQLVWYTCLAVNGQLMLVINGEATLPDYELLLQSVTYATTEQEPDKDVLRRTVSVC